MNNTLEKMIQMAVIGIMAAGIGGCSGVQSRMQFRPNPKNSDSYQYKKGSEEKWTNCDCVYPAERMDEEDYSCCDGCFFVNCPESECTEDVDCIGKKVCSPQDKPVCSSNEQCECSGYW